MNFDTYQCNMYANALRKKYSIFSHKSTIQYSIIWLRPYFIVLFTSILNQHLVKLKNVHSINWNKRKKSTPEEQNTVFGFIPTTSASTCESPVDLYSALPRSPASAKEGKRHRARDAKRRFLTPFHLPFIHPVQLCAPHRVAVFSSSHPRWCAHSRLLYWLLERARITRVFRRASFVAGKTKISSFFPSTVCIRTRKGQGVESLEQLLGLL